MAGPIWARWAFVLVFAAIGAHCTLRLLLAHRATGATLSPGERGIAVAHLAMAAGMTVMFAPLATPIPPAWWAVGFGMHTAWLGIRSVRHAAVGVPARGMREDRGHLLSHVLAGVVMTYMFAVMPADALLGTSLSHAGHLAATSPVFAVLGWVAAVYFLVDTVRSGVRVAAEPPNRPPRVGAPHRSAVRPTGVLAVLIPHGEPSLRLLMGLGMSYMLLTML
jgi:hypothetical protein